MGSRKSRLARLRPFLVCAVLFLLFGPLGAEEKKRAFEVFSDARFDEALGDFTGVELELFLWDGTAEATLTVHGRGDPIKLRGTAQGDEVSVSATDGEHVLELSGARHKKRFQGTLLLKRKGKTVWEESLRLPRRRLGKT